MLLLELGQPVHKLGGQLPGEAEEPFLPGHRQIKAATAGQHVVDQHERTHAPGVALVGNLQTQEIEEKMQVLAIIRLRRGRVVVLVFLVVFDQRLQNQLQPALGFGAGDRPVKVVQERHGLKGIGIVAQVIEVVADAAVQDAAQVGKRHELGVEEVVAVALDKSAETVPVGVTTEGLERGEPQRLAMFDPEKEERPRELVKKIDQLLIQTRPWLPGSCRIHHGLDHRLESGLEKLVEFGHAAAARRVGLLHAPGRF